MERLLSDTEYWNGDNVFVESYSNIRAQLDFLKTHAVSTAPEFGMLIEGGYWEQESFEIGNINQVAVYGDEYKRENRRIAYMPMPMPTIEMVESHKGHNLVSSGAVMVVASATAEDYKIPLIKDFIQFCFTDENLRKTTITTSMFCAYDYEFGAEDYAKLSPYGQSIADYMQAETTHIRMATSKNPLYIENSSHFDSHRKYATKLIGSSSTISSMFDVLKEKSVTAKDYFLGYKNRTQATWATDYSKYINN
jgi:hypothetical protein